MNFRLDGTETCWLIYADWLEDQGQVEKACLIRGQIQDYFKCCRNMKRTGSKCKKVGSGVTPIGFDFNRGHFVGGSECVSIARGHLICVGGDVQFIGGNDV